MTRAVPNSAAGLVRAEEELVLRVYDDAHPKRILHPGDEVTGTLTAGYGHTGLDVHIGMTVTQRQADLWLDADLSEAASRLEAAVGRSAVDALTSNQYAAMISFVFNLGLPNGGKGDATIFKRIKAGQYDQVPIEMQKFTKARVGPKGPDGKPTLVKLDGLVRRRSAEVVLWSTAEPGSSEKTVSSSATREADTPPTSSDPTPAAKSGAILVSSAGIVAAAAPVVDQARKVVEPYAHQSEMVQRMLGVLAILGAFLAVAGVVLMWMKTHQAKS